MQKKKKKTEQMANATNFTCVTMVQYSNSATNEEKVICKTMVKLQREMTITPEVLNLSRFI